MPPIGVLSQTLSMLWVQFPTEAFERTHSNHSSRSSKGGSGRRGGTSRKKSLFGCRRRGEVGVRTEMNSLGPCHSQHAIVLLFFPNGVLSLGKKREGGRWCPQTTKGPCVLLDEKSNPACNTCFPRSLSVRQEQQ